MRIRRAVIGDEELIRAVRLRAITDAPEAFSSTFERELARTADDWRAWIMPGATFLLEQSDGEVSGLVAASHDHAGRSIVWVASMWLAPEVRGVGAGDALMHEFLAWAATTGAQEARLRVADGNDAARKLYERHGFRDTGTREAGARGMVEVEMVRPAETPE
jgi:ribosomal protein S18 acetylase RimI-like enzyme